MALPRRPPTKQVPGGASRRLSCLPGKEGQASRKELNRFPGPTEQANFTTAARPVCEDKGEGWGRGGSKGTVAAPPAEPPQANAARCCWSPQRVERHSEAKILCQAS